MPIKGNFKRGKTWNEQFRGWSEEKAREFTGLKPIKEKTISRLCLNSECRAKFQSKHAGHRMCDRCRPYKMYL